MGINGEFLQNFTPIKKFHNMNQLKLYTLSRPGLRERTVLYQRVHTVPVRVQQHKHVFVLFSILHHS